MHVILLESFFKIASCHVLKLNTMFDMIETQLSQGVLLWPLVLSTERSNLSVLF